MPERIEPECVGARQEPPIDLLSLTIRKLPADDQPCVSRLIEGGDFKRPGSQRYVPAQRRVKQVRVWSTWDGWGYIDGLDEVLEWARAAVSVWQVYPRRVPYSAYVHRNTCEQVKKSTKPRQILHEASPLRERPPRASLRIYWATKEIEELLFLYDHPALVLPLDQLVSKPLRRRRVQLTEVRRNPLA